MEKCTPRTCHDTIHPWHLFRPHAIYHDSKIRYEAQHQWLLLLRICNQRWKHCATATGACPLAMPPALSLLPQSMAFLPKHSQAPIFSRFHLGLDHDVDYLPNSTELLLAIRLCDSNRHTHYTRLELTRCFLLDQPFACLSEFSWSGSFARIGRTCYYSLGASLCSSASISTFTARSADQRVSEPQGSVHLHSYSATTIDITRRSLDDYGSKRHHHHRYYVVRYRLLSTRTRLMARSSLSPVSLNMLPS